MDKKLINLSDVKVLIFDEADQVLDKGFLEESNRIVSDCKPNTPLALFLATVSETIQELINSLFVTHSAVSHSRSGCTWPCSQKPWPKP